MVWQISIGVSVSNPSQTDIQILRDIPITLLDCRSGCKYYNPFSKKRLCPYCGTVDWCFEEDIKVTVQGINDQLRERSLLEPKSATIDTEMFRTATLFSGIFTDRRALATELTSLLKQTTLANDKMLGRGSTPPQSEDNIFRLDVGCKMFRQYSFALFDKGGVFAESLEDDDKRVIHELE